ncbi:MAG: methyltransferase domain-containing protein, partial [Planctomycetes bacterium]|nr:methyltransferase domain-containing protein [Planctomycetota bacterium]
MKPLQLVWLALLCGAAAAGEAPQAAAAREILAAAGVKGGLAVHLGCGDGALTAALHANERYLVHGLDTDPAAVGKARAHIRSLGLYGKVSVATFDGKRLPYVNDLVNLVVASGECQVPNEEILRVLAPNGVALVGGKRTVKPWPKEIDEWTHFLHGPDNNAVARDTRVGIPRSIQWVAEPRWGRSHEELASLSAAVTAKGRIYYIVDEAPLASIRYLSNWKLVARDAFNGTLLWKRPIAQWTDHLRHFRAGPAHLPRRLVAAGETVYVTPGLASPVLALDGATGETLREYKGTEHTEEIITSEGVLYLAAGTSEANRRGGGLSARNEPDPTSFRYLTAIEADTAKPLWKKDLTKENILPLSLAVKGQRAYLQSTAAIVCLDARSGNEVWRTPRATPQRRMSFSAPTLVATDEVVLCADRDTGKGDEGKPSAGALEWAVHGWDEKGFARGTTSTLTAYAASDGKELWSAKCKEGYNSPVDVFVIGGVVWVGPDFKGLDLKTGQVARQLDTKAPRVGMTHHRCYRNKASERFIFTSKSGVEVLGLEEGRWLSNNSWIRGTCQYGIIPANGLLYAPPDACACFLTVKAPGFYAAAPQRDKSGHMPFPDQPVIERGPAYGAVGSRQSAVGSEEWPMYRHD